VYFVFVIATTIVFPIISAVIHGTATDWEAGPLYLFGLWWVFWGVGIRLLSAGISQIFRPRFTSKNILGIDAPEADQLVQELGFANTAMGLAAVFSSFWTGWAPAAGFVGGAFLLLAGIRHISKPHKNSREILALVTDLLVGVIGVGFGLGTAFGLI
jgi:hypothetical protein